MNRLKNELLRLWRALSRTRMIVFLGVYAFFYFVKSVIDPWGVSEMFQEGSAKVTLSLAAPWYRNFDGAEEAGSMISTLLIDEVYLDNRGKEYPLTYHDQQDLLTYMLFRDEVFDEPPDAIPNAVMLDLLYADDREGQLAAFAEDLHAIAVKETRVGLRDRDGLLAAAASTPRMLSPAAGVLTADEFLDVPSNVLLPTSALVRHEKIANIFAAPSLLAPGVLRYALAPEGYLSPALQLAIWTCAALDSETAPRLAGCGATPIVSNDAIAAAAYAAAKASIAEACAEIAAIEIRNRNEKKFAEREATEPINVADKCRTLARKRAVNADWAMDAVPDGSDPVARSARILAEYARMRRDAQFEGAEAGANCVEATWLRSAWYWPADEPLVWTAARCRSWAQNEQDARIGPTMTVLWGASPRDGGPSRRTSAADLEAFYLEQPRPAAPYTWAKDFQTGLKIPDKCFDHRFEDGKYPRLYESLRRAIAALGLWSFSYPDLCPYHPQIDPDWLDSAHTKTRRYVDHAIHDRTVIVGASVAGVADLHEMRSINAPGVWGHAMALDNLLVLGRNYREANYDGRGFDESLGGRLVEAGLELFVAVGLGLLLMWTPLLRWLDCAAIWIERRTDINKSFSLTLFEAVAGGAAVAMLMLPFSVLLIQHVPAMPPFDWLGVGAVTVLAWAAADKLKRRVSISNETERRTIS